MGNLARSGGNGVRCGQRTDARLVAVHVGAMIAAWLLAVPTLATAQGFISPSIGFNFGGQVTDCENLDACKARRAGYGVSIGYLGSLFGFEEEIVYTPTFFGDGELSKPNTVTTIMSNLLLVLPFGPVRPYGTVGAGAMRTSADFNLVDSIRFRDSGLGWVMGGGVLVLATERLGVRVDIRDYRRVGDFEVPGLMIPGSALDFARASASAVITF